MKFLVAGLIFVLTSLTSFASQTSAARFLGPHPFVIPVSFESNFSSYPQPQDFFRLAAQKFSLYFPMYSTNGGGYTGGCFNTASDGTQALGQNDPGTGQPVFKDPTPAFVRWFNGCMPYLIQGDVALALIYSQGNDHSHYLSDKTWAGLKTLESTLEKSNSYSHNGDQGYLPYGGGPGSVDQGLAYIMGMKWSVLISYPYHDQILEDLFDRFVGPGVLSAQDESKYLKVIETSALSKGDDADLYKFITTAVGLMMLTPEFLTTAP